MDPETFASLLAVQPRLVAGAEPNDSIGPAIATGLTGPGSVRAFGVVGDGDFGQTSGDFDFYSFQADANQKVSIEVNPKAVSSNLDAVIGLYDSAGNKLAEHDFGFPGDPEFLTFVMDKADTYFAVALGCCKGLPADPFTPGSGGGAASTGAYRVTITIEAIGPGAVEEASLAIKQDQRVLLLVTGDAGSAGSFDLEITNLDQFTTPEKASLLFLAGSGPSQAALVADQRSTGGLPDLNADGNLDMVVADAGADVISVLLGNGDGTFQAPRQFAVGAFVTPNPVASLRLGNFRRQVAIADFNGDDLADVAVTNYDSADISVLLGRGEGSFEPQRRFDATRAPFDLDVGDFDGDGHLDLVAVDATSVVALEVAVLFGRGDGTFAPQQTLQIPTFSDNLPWSAVRSADLNEDGYADFVVSGGAQALVFPFLSNGDQTFTRLRDVSAASLGTGIALVDVNGDDNLDVINTGLDDLNQVSLALGNGDGTFQERRDFLNVGHNPIAVAIADLGSEVALADGSTVLGPPDGHADAVVAVSGLVFILAPVGPPQVVVLPGLVDAQGQFSGFGAPQQLAPGDAPSDVDIGHVNEDGALDVVVVDRDGVRVIYGQPAGAEPSGPQASEAAEAARDLGTVVHLVEPTLTLVPGHEEAFFTLTVPTEAAPGAGDEVIDFSALFEHEEGAGLSMEVRDAADNLLGSGERFRIRAAQGEVLTLHVFGVQSGDGTRGFGAYTLVIDVLPQIVGIESQPLLPGQGANPGGATASVVITFQGDRLDRATAEDPDNYHVTGPDGPVIPIDLVYDPSANVEGRSDFQPQLPDHGRLLRRRRGPLH